MDSQLELDWNNFLQRFWQKRPVIIKRTFRDFVDPLSPDELVALAMEAEVDSRLVSHDEGDWQISHGPFASYENLGDRNWSLLMQVIDH